MLGCPPTLHSIGDPPSAQRRLAGMPARMGSLSTGRTQASSHNYQGVVDGGINEAGVRTAAPDRSALYTVRLYVPGLCWMFATMLLQHPNGSQQGASRRRRVMSDSCEVTEDVGDT